MSFLPLHTITLAGRPLRIYASPRTGPDHPWASFDDLAALAELDRDEWAGKLRQAVPDELQELPDGTLLLSEPMTGGLFVAWIEMGCEPAQALHSQWQDAWRKVFGAQYCHLPRAEWLAACQEAAWRNEVFVPGVTVVQ